jgi:hypothetical protein
MSPSVALDIQVHALKLAPMLALKAAPGCRDVVELLMLAMISSA